MYADWASSKKCSFWLPGVSKPEWVRRQVGHLYTARKSAKFE